MYQGFCTLVHQHLTSRMSINKLTYTVAHEHETFGQPDPRQIPIFTVNHEHFRGAFMPYC